MQVSWYLWQQIVGVGVGKTSVVLSISLVEWVSWYGCIRGISIAGYMKFADGLKDMEY